MAKITNFKPQNINQNQLDKLLNSYESVELIDFSKKTNARLLSERELDDLLSKHEKVQVIDTSNPDNHKFLTSDEVRDFLITLKLQNPKDWSV